MNLQRLTATLGLVVWAFYRAAFPVLALVQLAVILAFALSAVVDVGRTAPTLTPSLRHGLRIVLAPFLE